MRAFWTLLRAGLRANFGFSLLRHRLLVEKKDRWLVPLIVLGIIGALPAFYFGYLMLIKVTYSALLTLGQEKVILTVAVLFGQLLVLVLGVYYVIAAFYFSSDLELLIPLPLKPVQVIAAKWGIILINEYLTLLPLVLPVLIYFGILAHSPLSYWLLLPLVYLLLPVIPLAIISLLAVGLMRLVNLSRKKDALIIVGSLLLMVVVITMQFQLGKLGNKGGVRGQEALVRLLTSRDGLVQLIGSRFPPSIWASEALGEGWSRQGIKSLALLAGASLFFFYGLLWLGQRLFYHGLIGLKEVASRRPLARRLWQRRVASGARPLRAIFLREWRLMNRTPIFFLNGVLVIVLVPLLFFLGVKSGGGRGGFDFILQAIASGRKFYVILATAGFLVFCSSLNGTASSTFSREGGQFWISKVIPVSWRKQVQAKFFHSYLIALLGVAGGGLVAWLTFKMKALDFVIAAALALAAAAALTAIGMAIDLARPLLDWINPQKAIKQNLNVLLAILADILVLTLLTFFSLWLSRRGLPPYLALALLLLVLLLAVGGAFALLFYLAERRYPRIEI